MRNDERPVGRVLTRREALKAIGRFRDARTLAPVPALILSFLMILHLPATSSPAQAEVAVAAEVHVHAARAQDGAVHAHLLQPWS